ncbi:hypothetical protein Tco_0075603, partial [Tanacetum coccineum]
MCTNLLDFLDMVPLPPADQRHPWLRLHTEQEMEEVGFGAYWVDSDRVIPDKLDLRDYWIEILSEKDFLGPAPSYVLIRDPVKRLCHRMIAYSNSGRGHAEGRKSEA